mmetsp:Transcript_5060/g.7748  ORF Transcript_5060/g.7748 Transcript_5060/m.7748 type:complete len:190 (-) Transcript_5060:2526-3095(-)
MPLRPYTDKEFQELPHVILTSPDKWVPTCMDSDPTTEDEWFDTFENVSDFQRDSPFDEYGEYKRNTVLNYHHIAHADLDDFPLPDDFLYQPFLDPHIEDDWDSTLVDEFGFIEEYYDALAVHASDTNPAPLKPPPEPPPNSYKPIHHCIKEPNYESKLPYFCYRGHSENPSGYYPICSNTYEHSPYKAL